jgi:hypothetical protein
VPSLFVCLVSLASPPLILASLPTHLSLISFFITPHSSNMSRPPLAPSSPPPPSFSLSFPLPPSLPLSLARPHARR